MHAHTTVSDGTKSPEVLVSIYKENGYDFLAITDHSVVAKTGHLSDDDFLLIPGEEICVGNTVAHTLYHIVALGVDKTLPFEDFKYEVNPQEVIDTIKERGGIPILAHPYWSGLNHDDMMKINGYHGVEVYNTSCAFERNTGSSEPHIDGIITAGRKPFIYATDDHHGAEMGNAPLDACAAWINVRAEKLTRGSIIDAIRGGYFYASTGPEFKDISIDKDGVISVECSPVKYISFVSTPSLGLKYHAIKGPLTKARYPGRLGETYVRVEIEDYEGRKAWSNPIYNVE